MDSFPYRRKSFRQVKAASDCIRKYDNKSHKNVLVCNGEGNGKIIRIPYPGMDHHQKLTDSSDSYTQS